MTTFVAVPHAHVQMPGVDDGDCNATPCTHHRLGRVVIARGVTATTLPGSMYATMLKVLASLGKLDRHDNLFSAFMRVNTPAAALRLIKQIGVSRAALESHVRADEEFLDHCEKRTIVYRQRAARGDKKYQAILKNPKICDSRGRWIGDLDEGINILSGARTLVQARRGKNLRILNKAGLMFDTFLVGEEQHCFLYSQKHHRNFLKALSLLTS